MKNEAAEANAKLASIRSQTHNGKTYERSDVEYMLALAVTAGGGLGAIAPQWFRDQAKLIAGTLDQLAAVTDTENFQRGLAIKAIVRIGELEEQLAAVTAERDRQLADNAVLAEISEQVLGYREGSHCDIRDAIEHIKEQLADKERECEAAETAYKQTDAENERLNIELAKVQVEIAAKERELKDLVDALQVASAKSSSEEAFGENVTELVMPQIPERFNIAPAAEGESK